MTVTSMQFLLHILNSRELQPIPAPPAIRPAKLPNLQERYQKIKNATDFTDITDLSRHFNP